jgi:hypothetical protein
MAGAGNGKILSSDWSGLNPLLLARIYEVRSNEDGTVSPVADAPQVHAPIIGDTSIEYTLSWQSPFENMGPETKAPALAAMLQAGALQPVLNAIAGNLSGLGLESAAESVKKSNQLIRDFEGRTGMTRLNSTQVFSGMPPVKIPITLLFRAFFDAYTECEAPFAQLMQWALPGELSKDGALVNTLQSKGMVDVLMPSKAPALVALDYRGKVYAPLVIESIAEPITSPMATTGNSASMQVPITLCTLTAMDAPEMASIRRGANMFLKST